MTSTDLQGLTTALADAITDAAGRMGVERGCVSVRLECSGESWWWFARLQLAEAAPEHVAADPLTALDRLVEAVS